MGLTTTRTTHIRKPLALTMAPGKWGRRRSGRCTAQVVLRERADIVAGICCRLLTSTSTSSSSGRHSTVGFSTYCNAVVHCSSP